MSTTDCIPTQETSTDSVTPSLDDIEEAISRVAFVKGNWGGKNAATYVKALDTALHCMRTLREALTISHQIARPKPHVIRLTGAEVQSQHDRQRWAEGLILQLPIHHDGRNSWLLNYGTSEMARELRKMFGHSPDLNAQSHAINPPASA